jgi:hypothetical protein
MVNDMEIVRYGCRTLERYKREEISVETHGETRWERKLSKTVVTIGKN